MHDERKVEYLVVKCEYRFGDFFTKEVVKRLKSADVEEVVRCKDCRFSEVFQNDSSGVMARYCKAFTLNRMVADDDYCSYGERKSDD